MNLVSLCIMRPFNAVVTTFSYDIEAIRLRLGYAVCKQELSLQEKGGGCYVHIYKSSLLFYLCTHFVGMFLVIVDTGWFWNKIHYKTCIRVIFLGSPGDCCHIIP